MLKEIFQGIYRTNSTLLTRNFVSGQKVYGEHLVNIAGKEYRTWAPERSKLAAAIMNGLKMVPLEEGSKVLYLGSAEGTTVTHISDIVLRNGLIFGVDISAKVMQKFTYLCESRENIVPILSDAARPESYLEYLEGYKIDLLYQDVSQKQQAKIFLKNARMYLKKGGYGLFAVKARSISATESVKDIIQNEAGQLTGLFDILQVINLQPYDKEHAMLLCRRK